MGSTSRGRAYRNISRRGLLVGTSGFAAVLAFGISHTKRAIAQNSTAEQEAIECLNDGDTQCAVDVFQAEFEDRPYDDDARENLFFATIVHGLRELDRGFLYSARQAAESARKLIPNDNRLDYLSEATSDFISNLVAYSGELQIRSAFSEVERDDFEARVVPIDGVFGEPTYAVAFTGKSPGNYNTVEFDQWSEQRAVSLKLLAYPTSDNGIIYLTFGKQLDNSVYALSIRLAYGGEWRLDYFDGPSRSWNETSGSHYLSFAINQWHPIEVRLSGSKARFFVDYVEIGSETILEYEPGEIGFGVGVDEYANSAVFSTAFMDISLYSLEE